MLNTITFALRYLRYFVKSKHSGGHGIHSPFIYEFAQNVIFSNKTFLFFKEIDKVRKSYKQNKNTLKVIDYGAGSRTLKTKHRKIKAIAKSSSTQKKYGKLISRTIVHLELKNIIEIGTSLGIGTLYLAYPQKTTVHTIEGDTELYKQATKTFKQLKLDNIKATKALFETSLPKVLNKTESIDLVYFDGNHKAEPTLQYFELCLTKASTRSVFIFDDIHWSAGMEEAWGQIKKHPRTKVTIDLFQMGIVFFREELSTQHYVIKYF